MNTRANGKRIKGSSAAEVYDTLQTEILTLKLSPGTPLDEKKLSERFGLSRSPIREALIRLAGDGHVVMLSNRSTLVAPFDITAFPKYVEALDLLQRVNTRLAATFRTDADIEAIRASQKAFQVSVTSNDYLAMSSTNKDFHMAIAEAGKNPYLTTQYGKLLDEGRRMLHLHFDYLEQSTEDELLTDEHEELITAIVQQDAEKADQLAHQHTRQFRDRFVSYMQQNQLAQVDISLSLQKS